MFDKSLYNRKGLFHDINFKNGFKINRLLNGPEGYIPIGEWTFSESKEEPSWLLIQWYSKHCFVNDRKDTGSPYIIADNHDSKTVIYNPEDGSLSMNLNAKKVYEGEAHTDPNMLWPHLLIEQVPICDYDSLSEEDKSFYRADCDRIQLELDIRMPKFEDTTNPEGINACQFMAYFYLTPINMRNRKIWFGVNFLDSRWPAQTYWNIDTVGTEMIYCLSCEDTFGGLENSYYDVKNDNKVTPSDEWKHIELDLTPHLDKVIELANKDNTFGRQMTRSDFFMRGNNLGFEIHGNFDCTFDIRNYDLVAYNKK